MNRKKYVAVVVDPETGKVEVDAVGYAGKACLSATRPIIDALGIEVDSDTPKPEMKQTTVSPQSQQTKRRQIE